MVTSIALKNILIKAVLATLWMGSAVAWSHLIAPEHYGVYSLVMTTVGILGAFLYAWMSAGLPRHFQDRAIDQGAYVSTVLGLYLIVSAALACAFALATLLFDLGVPPAVLLACYGITVLSAWFNVSLTVSMARLRIGHYGLKSILNDSLRLALGIALALLGWQALGLLTATVVALAVTMALTLHKDALRLAPAWPDRGLVRAIAQYGVPVAITMGLARSTELADRYIILWLMDETAVGRYAMAWQFGTQPMMLVLTAVSAAILPMAARAYEEGGDEAARDTLARYFTTFSMVALPILAVEVLFAPELAGLFLGPAYRPAAAALVPILALGVYLSGLRAYYLDMSVHLIKRTRALAALGVVIALANVAADIALIPWLGLAGAAYATLAAHALGIVYFFVVVPRARVLGWHAGDLAKVGLAVLVLVAVVEAGTALWGLPGFVVGGFAGGALYLALLLAMRTGELPAVLQAARARLGLRPG